MTEITCLSFKGVDYSHVIYGSQMQFAVWEQFCSTLKITKLVTENPKFSVFVTKYTENAEMYCYIMKMVPNLLIHIPVFLLFFLVSSEPY